MKDNDLDELSQNIKGLETKVDKTYEMIKAYMDEVNWFVSESAGAIVMLKNIYEKKSRS